MPDNEREEERGIELSVASLGWIIAFVVMTVLYTMFVYDKGVAKGMTLAQKCFYIEHYHAEDYNGIIDEGVNVLPEKSAPIKKRGKQK